MSKLKIGITIRAEMSIWSNGLDQNIYFLYKMLEDIGYEPIFISEDIGNLKILDVSAKKITYATLKELDIILEVAHPLSDNMANYYNSMGKPLIGIKYGNTYMIDLESYVSDDEARQAKAVGTNRPFHNREIWVSEQYYKFKDYYETLTRAKVRVIPYIWDSMILRDFDENFHMAPMKVNQDDFKKIAIVEPNINILKNSMVPLAICNAAYLKDKDCIKHVYCFNAKQFGENKTFLNYVKNLKIFKDNKTTYEGRMPLYKIFKENHANTIVSTQFFNEQNYVYAETLFYKRLLVHNSPMFKEVGIYYPEFDVSAGGEALLDAIYNFDQEKNTESYEAKLESLSIYNKDNQEKTKELIESVIK
jgi:hypothetical protein